MLVRAIALSIALLIGIGVIIPLATEYAEAGPKKVRKYQKKKKRQWRGVKPYSKRWWQLYRAQERRKRHLAARRRSLRLRQIRLARVRSSSKSNAHTAKAASPAKSEQRSAMLPSGEAAPAGWTAEKSTAGELQFRVASGGSDVGSASISVVGPTMGETVATGRHRTLGGVPVTSLRREVINRMVRENGWVVNDYQKAVGNRTVYVVVAQSQTSGGRVQSRMFYFAEADGRIYSVATNSSADAAGRLAEESEKVINSLQGRSVQQAAVKE